MPIQDPLPNVRDLPSDVIAVPDAVRLATATAREAGSAYESAAAEKSAADAAVAQADEADRAADREAVATGKSLPTTKAGADARKAAESAGRKLTATEQVYRAAYEALVGAIATHHAEWTEALQEQRSGIRGELAKALAAYARTRAVRRTIDGTLEALVPFAEGYARPFGGFPSTAQIEREASGMDFVRSDVEQGLSATRRFQITEDMVDTTLIELELMGAGIKPWTEWLRGGVRGDATDTDFAYVEEEKRYAVGD